MGFFGSLIACFWAMGPNKETLFCELYVFIFPIGKITLKLYQVLELVAGENKVKLKNNYLVSPQPQEKQY